jgi:hypothetical protein
MNDAEMDVHHNPLRMTPLLLLEFLPELCIWLCAFCPSAPSNSTCNSNERVTQILGVVARRRLAQ